MQEENRFEDFVGLIAAIDKEIQRIKAAELARFGLKASDLMIVYYLERNPEGLSCAEIARLAEVDRALVTRVVARLSKEGFVEVAENAESGTRYKAPVRITQKGHEAMTEVNVLIAQIVSQAGSRLSDQERKAMYAALSSVLMQLKDISR